jgi:hypothetical protein
LLFISDLDTKTIEYDRTTLKIALINFYKNFIKIWGPPMKKTMMNFLTFFFLISLASPAAFAITWGTSDGTSHPYVGIMYFETPSGIYRGTGALLSSTVFLTAGHCTEESGVVNLNS